MAEKPQPLAEAEENVQATKIARDQAMTSVERAKTQEAYQRALRHRDQLLGAFNSATDEKRLVDSPRFQAVMGAIFDSLKNFPDALVAVEAALAKLDKDPDGSPKDLRESGATKS